MRGSSRLRGIGAAGAALGLTLVVAVVARADEPTIAGDLARSGWDAAEPGLTTGAIGQPDFGPLFDAPLPRPAGADATTFPNQVYAQPLLADGKLVVATEENQVDALDPVTGSVVWSVGLGPAWTPTPTCGDLVPHVGITATPVYDPATRAVYVVTKTADGADAVHPNLRLHALDIDDGAERAGWPLLLAGAASNSGQLLDPGTANPRPGLLLLGGSVYFATASHCDHGPYVGFVGGVTTSTTPRLTLWSSESSGASSGAGIWQSGGGLMSDGPGRIFIATGNGVSPAPGPGTTPPGQLAESVVRLAVGSDGSLRAADYFSPANNAALDQDDADLGSGAPVALPSAFGTPSHPHLLVIAGKDGVVRLLDRDALGGTAQGSGGTDAVVSSLRLTGVWGRAAVFAGGTDHLLYLLPSRAPLQALRVAPNAAGVPTLSVVSTSAASYGYTSGSPVVTSDGDDSSGALVWVVTCSGSAGTDAVLNAFPAVPPAAGDWRPVVSFPLGTVAKFVQPATDGGRIYVATRDGRVLGFGRPTAAVLTAPATDFGAQPVGAQVSRDVVLTAHDDVQVQAVQATAPFDVAAPPPVPVQLTDGGTLTVPVTFTPSAATTTTALLTVRTVDEHSSLPTDYTFTLTGTGTQDGVAATPSTLDFGEVHVGESAEFGITVRNTGTTDTTVDATDLPGAPFTALDAPAAGFVLAPQHSVTVTTRFSPTATGPASDALTIETSTGPVTVPLAGSGITGAPELSTPAALDFGNVAPGGSATLGLVVANRGTTTMTIEKAAPPAPPFVVDAPLSEGQRLAPGDSLTIPITVRPWSARPLHDQYVITADDGHGARTVPVSANTQPWTGQVVAPLGCLDVLSAQRANGTPAVSYPCNRSAAQRFTFGAHGSIRFGSASSTWCLAVRSSGTASGTPVELRTCNGTVAQQWRWDAAERLVNPHAGRCLDVAHHSPARNTPLVLYGCSTARSQKWDAGELVATRGQVRAGLTVAGQLCLTDPHGSSAPGTRVTIDACGIAGQLITHHGATLLVAGQCITVSGAHPARGAAVGLQPCSAAATQAWTPGTRGRLYNAASRLCLDVPHSRTAPGTALQAWTCNGTPAQSWALPG